MDFQNTNLQGGSLQISTEVIGKIARCAALEIDGVAEVSCGKQNKKLKDLLEASSIQSPVTVEMRDGTASITLNLMVSFGARIPAVAEKVQENVKTAVQNMTNVTVSRVNLVIAGLAAEGYTTIRGIGYIQRGYERFEEKLQGLGGLIKKVDSEQEANRFIYNNSNNNTENN